MDKLDEFLQKATLLRNKVTPSTKEYIRRGGHFVEFEEAVKNHIKKGSRVVIFGHTHAPQLKKVEGGIYANCGTWTQGSEPTYIACHENKIELREALTHEVVKGLNI